LTVNDKKGQMSETNRKPLRGLVREGWGTNLKKRRSTPSNKAAGRTHGAAGKLLKKEGKARNCGPLPGRASAQHKTIEVISVL